MTLKTPRLVIAGLSGDSGKTLVSLGLARACASRGLKVAPFKKGPDYIDAAWLSAASSAPGRNLDTFLMDDAGLGEAISRGHPADLMVVEGNRGLYDGLDAEGSHSTANLAKRMAAPVVLVVDVTKMTRTTAALVLGCLRLDWDVDIQAVVLNRVGTPRQEQVIRDSIAALPDPPVVVGAIPRLRGDPLPGRHLGLVTAVEHPRMEDALERAAAAVRDHVDLDGLLEIAGSAGVVEFPEWEKRSGSAGVRIGVFRDEAFSFYYPENLEALVAAGAETVEISPLSDPDLPPVDGLYLGGGFPEVHAARLADNASLRVAVGRAAGAGLPVYAECGGLMYLSEKIDMAGATYPMSGVLDLVVEHHPRPQGHGYVEARVDRDTPFFAKGERLRGHEFHYSRVVSGAAMEDTSLRLTRGRGIDAGRDGVSRGSVWASYLHLHALGATGWAPSFVALAERYRQRRDGTSAAWG
jgi:cobyrinic acid a,c-diamide synthase